MKRVPPGVSQLPPLNIAFSEREEFDAENGANVMVVGSEEIPSVTINREEPESCHEIDSPTEFMKKARDRFLERNQRRLKDFYDLHGCEVEGCDNISEKKVVVVTVDRETDPFRTLKFRETHQVCGDESCIDHFQPEDERYEEVEKEENHSLFLPSEDMDQIAYQVDVYQDETYRRPPSADTDW